MKGFVQIVGIGMSVMPCLLFSAEHGGKKKERLLTYSFDQATFACPHFSTNQVEMITQETNPVIISLYFTLEP